MFIYVCVFVPTCMRRSSIDRCFRNFSVISRDVRAPTILSHHISPIYAFQGAVKVAIHMSDPKYTHITLIKNMVCKKTQLVDRIFL